MIIPPHIQYFGDIEKASTLKSRALAFYAHVCEQMLGVGTICRQHEIDSESAIIASVTTSSTGHRTGMVSIYVKQSSQVIGKESLYCSSFNNYVDLGTRIYKKPYPAFTIDGLISSTSPTFKTQTKYWYDSKQKRAISWDYLPRNSSDSTLYGRLSIKGASTTDAWGRLFKPLCAGITNSNNVAVIVEDRFSSSSVPVFYVQYSYVISGSKLLLTFKYFKLIYTITSATVRPRHYFGFFDDDCFKAAYTRLIPEVETDPFHSQTLYNINYTVFGYGNNDKTFINILSPEVIIQTLPQAIGGYEWGLVTSTMSYFTSGLGISYAYRWFYNSDLHEVPPPYEDVNMPILYHHSWTERTEYKFFSASEVLSTVETWEGAYISNGVSAMSYTYRVPLYFCHDSGITVYNDVVVSESSHWEGHYPYEIPRQVIDASSTIVNMYVNSTVINTRSFTKSDIYQNSCRLTDLSTTKSTVVMSITAPNNGVANPLVNESWVIKLPSMEKHKINYQLNNLSVTALPKSFTSSP